MIKKINNNYYNWDISKGDYVRDIECTYSYEKLLRRKAIRKKFLKLTGFAGLAIIIITAFAFLIL